MAKRLRKLALTVDEDGDGGFFWALLESDGRATVFPIEIAVSERAFGTYENAMRAGYDAFATLAQEDTKRGPQADIKETVAIEPPDEEPVIPPRCEVYKDRLIETFCKQIDNGCYVSYARVHARDTTESEWMCPMVPFPLGGFIEFEEAYEVAFEIGEAVIDGTFEIEDCEVEEGGPAGEIRLRGLAKATSKYEAVSFS